MPLLTLKKNSRIVSFLVLTVPALIAFSSLSLADEPSVLVLPPMTVFGTKNADDTYTQTSEIAWHDANDPSIIAEGDGSYTARPTTKSYSLKTLLASLGRPRVNIDFTYAANSISMTAAGKLTLSTLLEALAYLDGDVVLEVTPGSSGQASSSNQLMKRRLDALKTIFERKTTLGFKIKSPKSLAGGKTTNDRSTTWRVQLRRMKG